MDYRQRRKEQAQQTEQAILQAAMELARENSFDKVSVRDICQRAGITTGAFYHHFRSKEDLLSRGFSPLDRHMEEALSGHETDAPPQRLWLILSTYASFIEAQGWELVARYYQRRLNAPDLSLIHILLAAGYKVNFLFTNIVRCVILVFVKDRCV